MCEKGRAVPVCRRTAAALASVCGCAALCGCGTRTGLLPGTDPNGQGGAGDVAEGDAAAGVDADAHIEGGGGVHCALNIGPVSSCDAGEAAGPVQLCTGKYAACVRVFLPDSGVPFGDFGCCMANPPENVPQCKEQQFFDAGCF